MSITSIAFNFFSQVAPAPATAPVAPTASAPAPAARSCEAHGHEQGRRNVLYEAMMAALRELGLTSNPPPAPTGPAPAPGPAPLPMPAPAAAVATPVVATTPSPVPSVGAPTGPAQPGTPPAVSVEEAVVSFAHALWQALRGADSGSRREDRGDDDHGHRGHHGYRRHGDEHGYGMSRGYSGLATRLESLAVRLDANTTGVTAAPAPAATPATPATPGPVVPVATPVVQATPAPTPVPTPTPIPAPAPATSPLALAFDAMMRVLRSLNPSAPSTDAAAPSLASFLHSLARGLGADTTMPALSGVGIVINISA